MLSCVSEIEDTIYVILVQTHMETLIVNVCEAGLILRGNYVVISRVFVADGGICSNKYVVLTWCRYKAFMERISF